MDKLYFHPERKKMDDIPVFVDSYYHEIITYFLSIAEVLEPKLVSDLDEIIPIYTSTEQVHEEQQKNNPSIGFMDSWNIVEQATEHFYPHLIELKKSLLKWGEKYNLVGDSEKNSNFLEIAMWAIPDKRDYDLEIEETKTFFKKIGRQVPNSFPNWSITRPIYFENEYEKDQSIKNPDEIYPFVFSPGYDSIHKINVTELAAEDYESILESHYMDVHFALKGDKEKIRGHLFGTGWDPRLETWKDFEARIDTAYKGYKNLYKKRTMLYMEKHGYVEGKPKKNKQHFEWLVRYQIQEWAIKDIADFYSKGEKIVSDDTVRKALNNVSDLLELKLR